MIRVYIALGSNLAQPLQQVNTALEALGSLPHTQFIVCSSFYRTKPLGPQNQPDFLNAVVALDTLLQPEQLLDHTQAIERNQGRVRKDERWGPRTLDLDMMLYGNRVIHTERLTVPHYGLKEREFMLYPLAEIVPDLVFPDGETLAERLKHVPKNGMELWHQSQAVSN
ncbi:2-amino-4-hydroxy-6-hydroxymethyldihydropteridine pyrophosphokinase [Chania multitudinisentens RB-25]|uniref:2-amino-4-hydroxy-6-hydroxymethyldihydropteridine pyrophosphokinase n=1 Tax=Chania multitudinisentens RB-25 TaxID=1441930 RepID=W0LAK8_9GAMM|nr:2-amino-4-hydroxy-6-hydroxymethyldihydropteridine diphosphokinase [Chania multitudinisentens]AHG19414.1 2-amino-4-hydroxy-6-hydroxymethyldihydropteridine pyrophosphokinase [Chania multitudinisentens RB-25]